MLSQRTQLTIVWIVAAIVYLIVAFGFFIPVAIGECLPRDAPMTAACDAAKQRDFWIYVAAFFAGLLLSACISLKRPPKSGPPTLLAWSLAPLVLVIAANALLGA